MVGPSARSTSSSRSRRLASAVVLALAAGLLAVVSAPSSLGATSEYAEMGAPFGGKWAYNVNVNPPYSDDNSSHPAVHRISGGGDFATDYYGVSGQDVRLRINNPSGGLSFSWASSSTSCGTSTRVNIVVDGALVGWIYFAHLVGAVTTGPISNNMVVGKVGNYSCAPGQHVHVEVKADGGNYACYQDYGHPGTTIGEGATFAGLGSTGATGGRQPCGTPPSSGQPFGAFDYLGRAPGGAHVRGWVIDPDTAASTQAHFYGGDGSTQPSNGAGALAADVSRQDVAAVHPAFGDRHGFDGAIGLAPGHHTVCMYGINIAGSGGNPQLGCKAIDISPEPYGALDLVAPVPGGVRVSGWAIDPDSGSPIDVHLYGGSGAGDPTVNPMTGTAAGQSRLDVAGVYPDYGAEHGFSTQLALTPGRHTVCAYGINRPGTAGSNQQLGCQAVTVQPRLTPSLTIGAPASVLLGSAATISGAVSGRDGSVAASTVRLLRAAPGGTWTQVATATTSGPSSAYAFTVPLTTTATFMVSSDESFTEARGSSAPVTVSVVAPAAPPAANPPTSKKKHKHKHKKRRNKKGR